MKIEWTFWKVMAIIWTILIPLVLNDIVTKLVNAITRLANGIALSGH